MNFKGYLKGFFSKNVFGRSSRGGGKVSPREGSSALWTMPLTSAMSVSTVYCCVRLLSDSVASLPVDYMKKRGGIFVPDPDSVLGYLLNVQPDPSMSAYDFWKQIVMEVLLTGNAYIVPVYSPEGGGWSRLVLCRRGTVGHDLMADTYTVTDDANGITGTYREDEVIHIKGMTGAEPKHGLSVLSYAAMSTEIAAAGDRETFDRFENGGNVRGIIGNDTSVRGFGEYQDMELENAARDINERVRSKERFISIPGQLQLTPFSLSSTDMQFLESRKFTVREICRFFGVHPSFVFDDTSNNYKSAEMANVAFLANTLNPLLRRIECEFQRKLFPRSLSGKRRIMFDRTGLYACDLDSKVKYQAQMIAAGLYTVNECRTIENRPPVEGGDSVLVSANLKGITELTAAMADIQDEKNGKEQQ